MRPVHLSYDEKSQNLFASTDRGTIVKFDSSLNRLMSSDPVYGLNNLFVMTLDERFVYARDISGKLIRWHKDSLKFDCMIDLCRWSDPEFADAPNVSHGLFIREGTIYVALPQGRMAKFRQSDLAFLGLSSYLPKALIESVDCSGPDAHFAVDFAGYLYKGDIDSEMEPVARIANGACHQIVYDKKYDRYWVTDDYHCGLAMFRAGNPKDIMRLTLTNDDVEWMSFNSDQSQLLVACFDRFIYRIENSAEPRVTGKFGPFKYQVNHVEWVAADKAFALTESGEIYLINPETGVIKTGPTGTNAVWDIQAAAGEPGKFWVAFEDGNLRKIEVSGGGIRTVAERNLELGMIRRVSPIADGAIVLTTHGHIARVDQSLEVRWIFETAPLLRDMVLREGRILFCSERGELTCLEAESGNLLWRRQFGIPLWSVTVNPKGTHYWAAARLRELGDQGRETSGSPADIVVGNFHTGEEIRREKLLGNVKRMKWLDDEHMLINGNGEVAASWVRAEDFSLVRKWKEWQLNTCEATLIHNSKLYTTTYGYQLNTYDVEGAILESAFPFEDYATSLAAVDVDHILAGGRGAFLNLFHLRGGLPVLAMSKRY